LYSSRVSKNKGCYRRLGLTQAVLLACLLLICLRLRADDTSGKTEASNSWKVHEWKLQTSLYTRHFKPDPRHNNHQKLIGIEAVFENDWLFGAAFFNNSFDQKTQFVYVGKSWPILSSKFWYFKLVGGFLHGYKEPYKDKIPLNQLGTAPAILPALGFRYKHVFVETNLAGIAAVTVTAGIVF